MDDTFALADKLERGAASAVIVGAGYIGVEMADALTLRGLAVSQIEQLPEVLPTVDAHSGSRPGRRWRTPRDGTSSRCWSGAGGARCDTRRLAPAHEPSARVCRRRLRGHAPPSARRDLSPARNDGAQTRTRCKDEGLAESHDDISLVASTAWTQVTAGNEEQFEEACEAGLAWHEFVVTSNA